MNLFTSLLPIILITSMACIAPSMEIPNPEPDKALIEKTWIWALDKTYEQRCQENILAQPLAETSLVLPYPNMVGLPLMIREKGSIPLTISSDSDIDRSKIIWRVTPVKEAHREYLAIRQKMIDEKKDKELIAWCEKQGLPECAELEYRRLLLTFRENFQQEGYQPLNKKWQAYADKHQSSLCLPLPLEGEWYVVPDKTGHHRLKASAAYAFDMIIQKNGVPYKKMPSRFQSPLNKNTDTLANYYAWKQPVLAQADGIVTAVENDHPDMAVGQLGGFRAANIIKIDYGGGISVLFAHLKKGSAKVKVGDRVKAGQVVGLVGNSGASGSPHLHFTLLDSMYSVMGRYRFEVKKGNRWEKVDGLNLKEGTYVRNIPGIFKPNENTEKENARK